MRRYIYETALISDETIHYYFYKMNLSIINIFSFAFLIVLLGLSL